MSVDMAQFHQVFFEESDEGLDVMEQGLLNLDVGAVDAEVINTIFRSAHSIKGGSATFGFLAIAEFTHVMETILDEMRNGERDVSQEVVDILLKAGDCLREMLQSEQSGTPRNDEVMGQCLSEMEALLETEGNTAPAADESSDSVEAQADSVKDAGCGCWKIAFAPLPHLMKTGNDPIRLINTLADLGEISLQVDHSKLPDFREIDEEACYLSWTIKLYGDVDKEDITEIFEWVDGDCELSIEKITPTAEGVPDKKDTKEDSDTEENQYENTVDKIVDEQASATVDEKQSVNKNIAGAAAVPAQKTEKKSTVKKSAGSIRVEIDKIDSLINMVGELVITQSMLSLVGKDFTVEKLERLQQGLVQLERHSRTLQESVMRIRMLPISSVFNRFPRLVRDLSKQLGKSIELKISGENTELDKTVIEQIGDPLVHLVRNSLDHGIENPAMRVAEGKSETGLIHLNAYHKGGSIVIEISDDGAGLNPQRILEKAIERGVVAENEQLSNEQIYELIMLPGFSTAEKVTDVSGRGVGMDVVRKNIQSLGGTISIQSEFGSGSTISITLPLTLAILDGQSVSVGNENYIVPIMSIVESTQIDASFVSRVTGQGEVFRLRDEYIPVIRLATVFGVESARFQQLEHGLLVIVENGGSKCGLFVDELLGQQQVVIKSLETNFKKMQGISGATILGDGSVAFILDIPGIVSLAGEPSEPVLKDVSNVHSLERAG